MPEVRRETLIESQEQLITLSDDESQALQALGRKLASTKSWWAEEETSDEERTAIACRPAGGGLWRVRVANAVGLVSIGDLQLAIQPKIPSEHLFYLFWRSGEFPRLTDLR